MGQEQELWRRVGLLPNVIATIMFFLPTWKSEPPNVFLIGPEITFIAAANGKRVSGHSSVN